MTNQPLESTGSNAKGAMDLTDSEEASRRAQYEPPLTVRRATMKDHGDILAIDASVGAYDAGDYLHGKLAMYLNDPDRICYVGEIHGKIVGFTLNHPTDDGLYLIGRLARLERGIRQSGAWEQIRNHAFREGALRYPLVKVVFGCTSSWKEVATFRKGWVLHMNRTYVHITINLAHILKMVQGPPGIIMEQISLQRCYQILTDRASHFKVFPHGMAVVGREPVRIQPVNFCLLTAECKHILASFDVSTGELRTMSFGTGFHSPQGYVYEVDLYTSYGNPEEMAQHFLSHIPVARRHMTCEKKLILSVFVCQKYGIQPMIDYLKLSDNSDAFTFSDVRHHVMGAVGLSHGLQQSEPESKL